MSETTMGHWPTPESLAINQPEQTYWTPSLSPAQYRTAPATETFTDRVRARTHEKSEQPKGTLGPSKRKEEYHWISGLAGEAGFQLDLKGWVEFGRTQRRELWEGGSVGKNIAVGKV